jgi:hypothetical protein
MTKSALHGCPLCMLACVTSSSSLGTGRPWLASTIRRQATQQVLIRCCGMKGGLDGVTIFLVQFSHHLNDLVAWCNVNNAPCVTVDRDVRVVTGY